MSSRASRFNPIPTALSASARNAGDSILRQIRDIQSAINSSKGNTELNEKRQKQIEELQRQYENVTSTVQAQVIAKDKAQAEQRARAGAVGAKSESVKQAEQRAIAAQKGEAVGTINENVISSSKNSVVSTTVVQPKENVGVKNEQGGIDYKVKLSDTIRVDEPVPVETPSGKDQEEIEPSRIKSAKYFGNVGSQSVRAEYELFEKPPEPEKTEQQGRQQSIILGPVAGVPQFLSLIPTEVGFKTYNVFGPQEKPEKLGPQRQIPDPLGVRAASQFILDESEKKSLASKKIIESDAPIFDFYDTSNSKAKAVIEQFLAEGIKDTFSIAGFLNLGGYLASLQKGTPYEEQIKVAPTKTGVFIDKLTETEGDVIKSIKLTDKEYTEKYGVVGNIAGSVIPLASLITLKPLSPFKIKSISLPLGETKLVPTLSKAAIQVEHVVPVDTVVYKGVNIGIPFTNKIQPLIGRAGNKIVIGTPKPKVLRLEELKPVGDGFEIGGGNVLEQKVLLSKQTTDYLIENKILDQQQVERIITVREGEKLASKAPTQVITDTFGEQPIVRIEAGPETKTTIKVLGKQQKKVIGKAGAIKGGLAQKPQLLPRFARGTHDFDLDVGKVPKAQRFAREFVDEQNLQAEIARSNRSFQTAGEFNTKVEVGVKTGAVYPINPSVRLGVDEALHGTSKASASNILRKGVNIKASKRGTGFFIAKTPKLATGFAKRASIKFPSILKFKYNTKEIIQFEKLPKNIRQRLYNPNWLKYQTNVIRYAKRLGKKGITKPYKSKNPFTARKEVIVIDKAAIKSVEVVPLETKPVLKNVEKVGEYLTHEDTPKGGSGFQRNPTFVLGTRVSNKTVKVEGLKLISLRKQGINKASSVISVQSKKGRLVVEPVEHRINTDIPDKYAIYKTQAVTLGEKRGKKLDIVAEKFKSLYPDVDFEKPFSEIGKTTEKIETEEISSLANSFSSTLKESGVKPLTNVGYKGQPKESTGKTKQKNDIAKTSTQNIRKINQKESSINSIITRESRGIKQNSLINSLSSFGNQKIRLGYGASRYSFGSKSSRGTSIGSNIKSLFSISQKTSRVSIANTSKPSKGSPISRASRLSISNISRLSVGSPSKPSKGSPSKPSRASIGSPFKPSRGPTASRYFSTSSKFIETTPYYPPIIKPVFPIPFLREPDKRNLFYLKRTQKYYTIYDVSKTPFGKIKYYVGKQQQSLKPIQEIKGGYKNPIGQLAPSNILDFKVEKIFNKKGRGKRNNYGFPTVDLF